jgi:hypothetical protein
MTQHVRISYRSHRKATWALVLGLAALAAAVVIPLAMAADKSYTMTASSPVCTGLAPTTIVTLNNTSTSQTLGSAEIYFPQNTVASASLGSISPNPTSTTSPPGNWDILQLNNLDIARRSSRDITVTFKPNVTFSAPIPAVVKQSNQFNDTQGTANLFSLEGSFPTLRVVTCVTVSGRVYQDRNLDNTYTTVPGNDGFLRSDVPKAWTVKLYAKGVGAASYPSTPFRTTSSSSTDGSYAFTQVPTGSDYKICVVAAGTDASSTWATQTPTGSDCGPISSGGPTSSGGYVLPALNANALSQDFLVVPVVGPFGAGDTSTVGGYTVVGGSNSTKADQFYVQDTWVDSNGQTNFRFSPITSCSANCPTGKIYLLETLNATISLSTLAGKQVSLRYDDSPPFLDAELKPMPYCTIDPRQAGGALATSGVLPGSNTSCIVEASQKVVAGGYVEAVYKVYTAYDGGRQVG